MRSNKYFFRFFVSQPNFFNGFSKINYYLQKLKSLLQTIKFFYATIFFKKLIYLFFSRFYQCLKQHINYKNYEFSLLTNDEKNNLFELIDLNSNTINKICIDDPICIYYDFNINDIPSDIDEIEITSNIDDLKLPPDINKIFDSDVVKTANINPKKRKEPSSVAESSSVNKEPKLSSSLEHKKTHSDELPFKCDCGKNFKTLIELNTHKKERPFNCDICRHCSKTSSDLSKHKKRHYDEQPYKCDKCEYSSKTSSDLNMHMKKHSDERAYKCDICGNSFKFPSNLNEHMKKIHKKTDGKRKSKKKSRKSKKKSRKSKKKSRKSKRRL